MSSFPCDDCDAPCCHHYHVGINGFDAYRIARELALPLADFVRLQIAPLESDEYRVRLSSEMPFAYRLLLRKVPAAAPPGERCPFLLTVGTRGRCGIYGLRPGACRSYPAYYEGDRLALGGKYCPPDGWQEDRIDVPLFQLSLRGQRWHEAIYHALVTRWNERLDAEQLSAAPQQFFDFLLRAYGAMETAAPSLLAATPPETSADIAGGVGAALRTLGWPEPATP